MTPDATTTSIVTGAVCLLVGSMVSPIGQDLWRKLKGTEYATKDDVQQVHDAIKELRKEHEDDCDTRHANLKQDCDSCKAATKASICSIQHEAARTKRLMILIAMQVGVSKEDLKDYL